MHSTALVASVLILSCLDVALSYPAGAPEEACVDMTPHHGVDGQSTNAPYSLTLSNNTYKCGDEITVTLAAKEGGNFKGFLCQARPDPASGTTAGSLSGNSSMTTNNCAGKASVTHKSRDLKESMVLKWKANNNHPSVMFVCTVVQDRATFWVKGVTAEITFAGSGNCPSGEATKPGVTIQILMLVIGSTYILM